MDLATVNVTTIKQFTTTTLNYLCINRHGTLLYATKDSKVLGIFTTNSTSFGVRSTTTISSPQGVALNSDETALIVADNAILKQINLSTTLVTPITHTTFNTPTGLKWYCLSSGICGILVADTTKVSFLRMRPASTSASPSIASSDSQTPTISNSEIKWSGTASTSRSTSSFDSRSASTSISRSLPTQSLSSSLPLPTTTSFPSGNSLNHGSFHDRSHFPSRSHSFQSHGNAITEHTQTSAGIFSDSRSNLARTPVSATVLRSQLISSVVGAMSGGARLASITVAQCGVDNGGVTGLVSPHCNFTSAHEDDLNAIIWNWMVVLVGTAAAWLACVAMSSLPQVWSARLPVAPIVLEQKLARWI
ncbi:Hypothetical protein, putative [Bodo saltans]|uniref:Uncharacterized protein n=1 Tax=Bodo saltans TaxID=75058 RepID=A0A0S4J670_BODSA|nr:Hypothetical protein, putative [Bodo saltans]|eukprot:CUG39232.1 Hypothetical protein, putative [Bodo saltans]